MRQATIGRLLCALMLASFFFGSCTVEYRERHRQMREDRHRDMDHRDHDDHDYDHH